VPTPVLARLASLAHRNDTALLCLTRGGRAGARGQPQSLGPLVSLRAEAWHERSGEAEFTCEARIVKDKRRGPHWSHREVCRGPAGLR
jgi:recombination protein RecA